MPSTSRIFWCVLAERSIQEAAFNALLDVAAYCGSKGYARIQLPYMRTDAARNQAAWTFLEQSGEPNDVLVMLDCDHAHPYYVVERLIEHPPERGVVAALGFRREAPFDPMFFWRPAPGQYRHPEEWTPGLTYECDAVATCAIAIRRWVLERLRAQQAGTDMPWFRYSYSEAGQIHDVSEDMYFAWLCQTNGIRQYCDTGLVTPHLRTDQVAAEHWRAFRRSQQEGQS